MADKNKLHEQFQFSWDCRPSNLLKWEGKVVAIDFGEQNVSY